MVAPQQIRHPVLHVMLSNAILLSIIYLVAGVVLELLRKLYPMRWVETGMIVLDSLPARLLHVLGWLGPLTEAVVYNQLSGFWLRVVFNVTTIVIIFALAATVAGGMALLGRLARRG
ncbi:MAG: hypothetical protein M3Y59_15685 [Myxococcota bacterium]|nr:hypothetical protein [Myxococcota bacterium]